MRVLLPLLVLTLAFISAGSGLEIIHQEYQVKNITTDGINHVAVVVFTVQFNESAAVSGVPLADLNQTVLTDDVYIQFFGVDAPMPQTTSALLGLATLRCGTQTFLSIPTNLVDGLNISLMKEEMLFPVPSTADPALAFFNSLYVDGSTNFQLDADIRNDTFSALLFLEDKRQCNPYTWCQYDEGLDNRLSNFNFSTCSLSFGIGHPVGDADPPYLHAVGDPDNPFVDVDVTGFALKELSPCDLVDLTDAADNFRAASLAISGRNLDDLVASFWRAIMFGLADPIMACQDLFDLLLLPITVTGQEVTDLCLLDELDPEYSTDPCCNKLLRYGDQCCSERLQNFTFPSATVVDKVRKVMRQMGCTDIKLLESSISDFLLSAGDNVNPNTGCSASAARLASSDVFNSYFGFVNTCRDLVQLDPPSCKTSSDCPYSNICFSQQCEPASMSFSGGIAHTQCFADYMPPTVSAITKYALGLPANATRDEFVAAMVDDLWAPNCLTFWDTADLFVDDSTSLFGFNYLTYSEDECHQLGGGACQYDTSLNYSECMRVHDYVDGDYVCAQCTGEYCSNVVIAARCTVYDYSQVLCDYLGGIWDLSFGSIMPCTLPGIDDITTCLDPSICPPPPDDVNSNSIKSYCGTDFCYVPFFSITDCVGTCDIPLHWEDTADGNGICVLDYGFSDCLAVGASWWWGRSWWDAAYDTEESCTPGACGGGGFFYIGTDGTNCTPTADDYTCTESCSLCAAYYEGNFLCINTSITTECDCIARGDYWANDDIGCLAIHLTRKECIAANLELVECLQHTTVDDCRNCTESGDPYCSWLGCYWDFQAPCRREEQCSSFGGHCSDRVFESVTGDCDRDNGDTRPYYCFTGCLVNATVTVDGDVYCPSGEAVAAGCALEDVDDPIECSGMGGRFINLSINSEGCLGYESGCLEDEFSPFFSTKNESECDNCLGSYTTAWDWRAPEWTPYAALPFYWKPIAWDWYLPYGETMDYTALEEVVTTAAVTRTRLSLQSEAQCLMNPLHSLLELIACQCTNVSKEDYKSICTGNGDGFRSIPIGSTLICSGAADEARIGGVTLIYDEDTIPPEYACLQANLEAIPAIQFAQKQVASLSSLSLSTAASSRINNEYAIVENRYGRQIGQLISNGLQITFTPLELAGSSKVYVVNTSIVVNNLTVCFDRNLDITIDRQAFPVLDLAFLHNLHFFPLFRNTTDTSYPSTGREIFCTTITGDGFYFPVYRVSDPNQPTDLFSTVEEAFIYIVAALFWIGFLIVLILIALTLYVHGVKGFCYNLFKGKQLAVMILCLLLFFSGLRGIWLCLAGSGVLGPDSSLALDAVLTDLPIYIFFSLFMLLIFFWAGLYHFQFKRKNSVLGRMRIPFILVNVFIYVFFVVIVIVYSTSNSGDQPTVELVYKGIVAGIGFTILISFMVYGGLLMYKSMQSSSMGGGKASEQFLRMTVITATCSVASLVQFIFLLLFAFADIESVVLILVYLFVVEVIPMYLLLWMFFQPKRLNETLTTSYGSTRQPRRSLPGSSRSNRLNSQGSTSKPSHSGSTS